MSRLDGWKRRVAALKSEVLALYLALRHPDTPVYAKLLIVCVVAYALSPVDLIPDFIPVLGLLDDLLIVPAGIMLARRLVPPEIMESSRERARLSVESGGSLGRSGAVAVVALWLIALLVLSFVVWRVLS